jgi:hypothetical protein
LLQLVQHELKNNEKSSKEFLNKSIFLCVKSKMIDQLKLFIQ